MIALARQQVTAGNVTFVAADILTWAPPWRFDTVFLPAGSRACPHPAFGRFWSLLHAALTSSGRVLFVLPVGTDKLLGGRGGQRLDVRTGRVTQTEQPFFFADTCAWVCAQVVGRTLEVAVGTGLNLPFYPAEADLTGINFSPAMLAVARRRAGHLGRAVDLREADALVLPFPGACFDAVVCTIACPPSPTTAAPSP